VSTLAEETPPPRSARRHQRVAGSGSRWFSSRFVAFSQPRWRTCVESVPPQGGIRYESRRIRTRNCSVKMAPQAGFEPATLRLTVAAGRFRTQPQPSILETSASGRWFDELDAARQAWHTGAGPRPRPPCSALGDTAPRPTVRVFSPRAISAGERNLVVPSCFNSRCDDCEQ
jgi:hypothetical protein